MSRSVMISFFVIFFVFSVQIVNTVNANYKTEMGIDLFPNKIVSEKLSGVNDRVSEFTDDNINKTFSIYATPTEQPLTSSFTEWIDTAKKGIQLLNILLYTIFYATVGFGAFLNDIGEGIVLIPSYITIPLTIAVNLLHIMNIIWFVRGVNFEE